MPIFEYLCSGCGHRFEELVLKSSPAPSCPSCESEDLERLLSSSSVGSDQTRARASRDIRARNRATRREHSEAEMTRIQAHSRDHDE